jgi:phosphoesterase RecJ-like protein
VTGTVGADRLADLAAARELMEGASKLVLTTHVQPDGDGIGSEVALACHLRAIGKDVVILNPHPTPPRFQFLEPSPPIVPFDPAAAERALSTTDALVVLDISVPNRLGKLESYVMEYRPKTLIIDHHADQGQIDGLDLRNVAAAATGELVYELLESWSVRWTPKIATALYAAIAYDTGGFRFANTRQVTHRIAADLITRGADTLLANENLFESYSVPRIKLLARVLDSFELSANGRVATSVVSVGLMTELGAVNEDVEGIVEVLRSIDGVVVATLIKEVGPSATKISFRSSGPYNVNAFASRFGGGGHVNAAGAFLREPLDAVVERVIPAVREEFDPTVGDAGRA